MLTVKDLSIGYGQLQIVWDISFHVEEGEIVSIVGSNGSGKSTILNTIAGAMQPMSGEITFLDESVIGLPAHKRVAMGLSLVPEGRQLFPAMTVLENLKLGAYQKEVYTKREESLKTVYTLFPRLKERQKQRAVTLSGGEQQMLAVGRAMMARPKLLMLDEPSMGLAPNLIMSMFDSIKAISEAGTPILLVEQNVRDALELADRGYVLETGKITLEGKGKELIDNPVLMKAYLGL